MVLTGLQLENPLPKVFVGMGRGKDVRVPDSKFGGQVMIGASRSVAESSKKENLLEKARLEAWNGMRDMGILEIHEFTANGSFLVLNDVDLFRNGHGSVSVGGQLKDLPLSRVVDKTARTLWKDERYGQKRADRTLYWLFRDVPVISKEDYTRVNPRGKIGDAALKLPLKSLFYIPKSEEAAFSMDQLRNTVGSYYAFFPGTKWTDIHPMRDTYFGGTVTMFEAKTAQMVYGQGRGERDTFGVLTVLSDVHNPASERQTVNGEWFVRNFGITTWNTPQEVLSRPYARRLGEIDILRKRDFDLTGIGVAERYHGQVTINGTRYNLGRKYAGCFVRQISHRECVVLRGTEPVLWFSTEIKGKHAVRAIARRKNTLVDATQGTFDKKSIKEMNMKVVRYGKSCRTFERVNMATEIPELLKFRITCEQRLGGTGVIDMFSLEDQVAIRQTLARVKDAEQAWKFIQVYQQPGLRLIADGFLHGRAGEEFDERIFRLANHKDFRVEQMVDMYTSLHEETQIFESEFVKRLHPTNQDKRPLSEIDLFANRIAESFYFRSRDFFVAASDGNIPVALEQMSLLRDGLHKMNSVFADTAVRLTPETVIENRSRGGGPVTSITWSSRDALGDSAKITLRPESILDGHATAHARFGFEFVNSKGDGVYLRVDHDDFGVSLDMGSLGSKLVTMLKEAGLSHHTQEPFERAFQDSRIFARYMKAIARGFGYDFDARNEILPTSMPSSTPQ